ncbi:trafficking protein particle complex subunit 4 [Thecamonas trahens ATCC 50062]|uniref:Trafficking protein particle complex subunit n=1 Tax=Thecamonas trahens ATCC 50062 TaxID=461836 RepID=A0A0L0DFH3_THETB|nr:trafficking protein particle complex subunit 4 [Thecamonas trahens ATCC 50062]KNC51044.1 trafficking protein particle complex subunit 4 [Thecamonas trahens ATCC 50062]|eukprot:XP_013756509.1 trafficking protein particle complex subunit 4 [Thecamonas trahens ATCC 50062]
MPIFSFYIINKAGGLIYQKDFEDYKANKLMVNEHLRLGGFFHGIHAIAAQVAPVAGSSGVEEIEASTVKLRCFQALTGTKFFVTASPSQASLDVFLSQVYEYYADFVLKNPFYELEQPIQGCDKFVAHLDALVASLSA